MDKKDTDENLYGNFLIPNIFIIVFGLGVMGVGIWMNAEYDVQAYLYVFSANPNGNMLLGITGVYIAAGILTVGGVAVGIVGVRKEKPFMLIIYVLLMVFVMLLEIIGGFIAVGFREQIYDNTLRSMQDQVKTGYMWENDIGLQWNRVQVRLRCCGADSAKDYRCSNWWYAEADNAGYSCPDNYYPATKQVPNSCCVLELNQNRDPERVPPQNPIPKNERRCNEDVAGNMWAGSSNVNGRGCFSALQDRMFLYIYILMGLGFCVGLFQVSRKEISTNQDNISHKDSSHCATCNGNYDDDDDDDESNNHSIQ
ncbi:hypothetical protein LSH36_255g06017 [Paralvinella palmiformis]|uniref:Tetraspanin n=1 Tax=Paralvinella palmiformis TaxID=53620 RepID=A0AAD9JLW5_9ANNE|nr:hypothetical protein LSH36_255g06017 [Paralvinella palmiformis]